MKAATIAQLKKDLLTLSPQQLTELCLRTAKYKKENKELLTYLLYESGHEDTYIKEVKEEIDTLFTEINYTQSYYVKKGFRKILRVINKYAKYSGIKNTKIELLIHFCKQAKASKAPLRRVTVLENIYIKQMEAIQKLIKDLHEDLQYDYEQEMKLLAI